MFVQGSRGNHEKVAISNVILGIDFTGKTKRSPRRANSLLRRGKRD
ncbi:Cytosolic Fe-S cluster assembly factor NAR1 [Frankliniella fusca]|uniref:Cytosolic Fe-S cluster assembly factor NAR1 n=1 Tax=Frankliniella fusca TaxID=407009 RepID=A0AAE1H4E2_9NEOP|nr:Cytosolic Fe-S cluster assembly factor NAR1 [Frankliniella fusca]